MSTSSNMSIQTHDTRFRNKMCYCRLRAAVRISESEKNPEKLYYDCPREKDKRKCKFWDWCNPIGYGEPNSADEACSCATMMMLDLESLKSMWQILNTSSISSCSFVG